jgi:hypothetical protein
MHTSTRVGISVIVAAVSALVLRAGADEPAPAAFERTPAVNEGLDRISADSLRGHLSFLASDLLRGRGTPSKGLDIAAEYIAAQFRRAGLEPIGDDGYFQTADWKSMAPEPGSFACEVRVGGGSGESIRVGEHQVSDLLTAGLDLAPTPVVKVDTAREEALSALKRDQVEGKIVLAEVPHPYKVDRSRIGEANRARMAFLRRMNELKPALVVDVDRDPESFLGLRLDVPDTRQAQPAGETPRITLHSPRLARAFDAMPAGPSETTMTVRVGDPKEQTVKVRNVVGLLRGSDPERNQTYVLLTAHYDHLGIGPSNVAGDRIFNGANDDGSGTVSVIEIASALATLKRRPERSVVFIAFYGEEFGMIGSQYYVAHPVVPLDRTVAAINLEQVGRTDDSDGPRVAAATLTGFDYSDVGPTLRRAGESVGIDVTSHPLKSDSYFGASDNAPFARSGIPAHTISVAYAFPDYHGADDEWEKIDYANMAKVDRMVALGLLMIANGPAPAWDPENPKAEPYRKKQGGP